MAKKKTAPISNEPPETIRNFTFFSPTTLGFDMTTWEDAETGTTLFSPSLLLVLSEFEDGTHREGIVLDTGIVEDDISVAVRKCLTLSLELFNCDMLSVVNVFDEEGELIEEIDLNDALENLPAAMPVGDDYDLDKMPVGVPIIRH